MYFVKTFKAGGEDYDPRQKLYAVFKCNLCSKDEWIDITRSKENFNFKEERRCKYCGNIDMNDKIINLKTQLNKLTLDKSRIDIEIDKIERELNEYATTEEVKS